MSKRIGVLGLGAAAVLASVTLASAADLGGPTPPAYEPYAPEFSWAGLYFGAHGGGGWVDAEHLPSAGPPAQTGINDLTLNGPYVGAHLGYDVAYAQVVMGAVADINWSGIDGGCLAAGCAPAPATDHDIDWFGTARLKLGYSMGNWLPYITGGLAWGGATRTSGGTQSATNTHSGWTIGAGAAWAISQNWIANVEYKYIDLGSRTYVFPVGNDPLVDLNMHTVEVGLSYKF